MTIIHTRRDIPYLPLPNVIEIVLDDELAPNSLTPTAFVLAFTEDGRIVMAANQIRGVEFPGGKRDRKNGSPVANYRGVVPEELEDIETTAVRELWEETGCSVSRVRPLGYHKNQCFLSDIPEGYRYPFPVSYQQFMIGMVTEMADYQANRECAKPIVLTRQEARAIMNPEQLTLAEAAWDLLPGFLAVERSQGLWR